MKRISILIIFSFLFTSLITNNCAPSCTNKQTHEMENEDSVKKYDFSSVAPSQVKVQATVLEIGKIESITLLTILIDKIIEYGQGTPPLAKGSNINVSLKVPTEIDKIKKNHTILALMRKLPIKPGNENNAKWEIISFKQ